MDEFNRWCEREHFRTHIRGIVRTMINDELHWMKIFDIDSIRKQVKSEVKTLEPKILSVADNYLKMHVPKLVTEQMLSQMPTFLRQSAEMRDVLEHHRSYVERSLETKARDILNNIVNDPQYHTINKALYESFENRQCDAITLFNTKSSTVINETKCRIDKETTDLRDQLNEVAELKKQLRAVQRSLNGTDTVLGVCMIGLIGTISYIALRPFHASYY